MTVYEKQNEVLPLKCLAARRKLNSRCKTVSSWRKIVLLVGVVFGVIQQFYTIADIFVGWYAIFLLVVLLIDKILKEVSYGWKITAAKLQQLFDATVFSEDCPEISDEAFNASFSKSELAELFKEIKEDYIDKEKLVNWYSETEGLSPSERVLDCQRQSITWDLAQRVCYIVYLLTLHVIFVALFYHYFAQLDLCKALCWLLLVSPYLGDSVDVLIANIHAYFKAKAIEEKIAEVEKGYVTLNANSLIAIQNHLYDYRRMAIYVPDWFYRLCRPFLDQSASLHAKAKSELK